MTNQDHNRESLIAHVNALETVIRERNKRIGELQKQLNEAGEIPADEALKKAFRKHYNKGWKDAYKAIAASVRKHESDIRLVIFEHSEAPKVD